MSPPSSSAKEELEKRDRIVKWWEDKSAASWREKQKERERVEKLSRYTLTRPKFSVIVTPPPRDSSCPSTTSTTVASECRIQYSPTFAAKMKSIRKQAEKQAEKPAEKTAEEPAQTETETETPTPEMQTSQPTQPEALPQVTPQVTVNPPARRPYIPQTYAEYEVMNTGPPITYNHFVRSATLVWPNPDRANNTSNGSNPPAQHPGHQASTAPPAAKRARYDSPWPPVGTSPNGNNTSSMFGSTAPPHAPAPGQAQPQPQAPDLAYLYSQESMPELIKRCLDQQKQLYDQQTSLSRRMEFFCEKYCSQKSEHEYRTHETSRRLKGLEQRYLHLEMVMMHMTKRVDELSGDVAANGGGFLTNKLANPNPELYANAEFARQQLNLMNGDHLDRNGVPPEGNGA